MRSFKKIAAMIMAVAMLCSFTALAAESVTLIGVDDTNSDNPTVTLGYDWESTTAAQTTMVLYKDAVANGDIVYINQFANGANAVELDLGNAYGEYTIVAGGTDVATAVEETFTYSELKCDVTLVASEGGRVLNNFDGELSATATAVSKGTKIDFEFLPFVGYTVEVEINGESAGVEAAGGKRSITVTEDTAINVVFTEVQATTEVETFTAAEIHDIEADANAENKDDTIASKLIFGKAIAPNQGDIIERGMYLEKWVTATEEDQVSGYQPYAGERNDSTTAFFKANGFTVDGRYGIRFIRFSQGRYRVSSYVKYGNAEEPVFGEAVEFVVE